LPTKKNEADHDILIRLDEQMKQCCGNLKRIEQNMNQHLSWSEKLMETIQDKYIPQFNRLQSEFNHVVTELPDKGFCSRVEKIYQDLYPDGTEEPSLPQKVNLMWNERRWIRGLLYALLGFISVYTIILIMKLF